MKRALLAFVFAALTTAGCAKAPPAVPGIPASRSPLEQLRADLTALLDQPSHQRTTWGVAVESLADHDRLFERNPHTLLIPASSFKLVTAAVAAASVGWDYVFQTRAEAGGPIEDGTLRGDLIITGTGDPSPLGRGGTDFVAALIDALHRRGIARIEGRVIGDDNEVEEPRPGLAWSWDDLGTTSGAVAGALNLAENTMRVVVRPGSGEGAPTVIDMPAEGTDVAILNRSSTAKARSPQTLWAEQRPGEAGLTIAGTLAADAMPATLTVAAGNPTLWFARFVRARLMGAGIAVSGAAVDVDDLPAPPPRVDVILSHPSRPLADIVRAMLKDSINLYAEAALWLATGRAGPRLTAPAIAAERRQLAAWGVADGSVQIADGSGLSRFDVIAPEALVAVLRQVYVPGGASPFMQALPIAGVDGTLADRMKGTAAAGNARAKTGSMTNVRSLAGYVTTADGEPLAFVILANNFEAGGPAVTATIDKVVVRLASFSRRAPPS